MMNAASKKGPAPEPAPALLRVEPLHVPISITRPTSGGSRGIPAFLQEWGIACHACEQVPTSLNSSRRTLRRALRRAQAVGEQGCGCEEAEGEGKLTEAELSRCTTVFPQLWKADRHFPPP